MMEAATSNPGRITVPIDSTGACWRGKEAFGKWDIFDSNLVYRILQADFPADFHLPMFTWDRTGLQASHACKSARCTRSGSRESPAANSQIGAGHPGSKTRNNEAI